MLLKECIRALVEDAVSGSSAIDANMGLYVWHGAGIKMYILYETSEVSKKVFTAPKVPSSVIPKCIVGYIQVQPQQEGYNGAAMVQSSAARKGFGPLMYDIAMADNGAIFPDRISTSDAAKNVWKFYATKRSDVSAKQIDNIEDPKTPEKEDDGEWVYDKLLDKSYHGKGQQAEMQKLKQNGDRFVSELSKQSGASTKSIEEKIRSLAMSYFGAQFKG